MKVCPKCGKVIGFNSYFGAYICDNCEWEDASYSQERIEYFSNKNEEFAKNKEQLELLLACTTV